MPAKEDPRILRTRRLIIQAFFDLLTVKSVEQMSVKDIAEKAQINRATFYYHFKNKQALLAFALDDQLMIHILKPFETMEHVDQASLKQVLHSLLSVKSYLSDRCTKSYQTFDDQIEAAVKKRLTEAFLDVFRISHPSEPARLLEATMLSWSLYGAVEVIHDLREQEKSAMIDQVAKRLLLNK